MLQPPTSTHKSGVQGAKPLAGGTGVSPVSFSLLRLSPKEASYERMSASRPCSYPATQCTLYQCKGTDDLKTLT